METETITEYREVTDDADFDSFGQFEAQRELAKGRLLGKLTQGGGTSVTTKAKAKASSSGMALLLICTYMYRVTHPNIKYHHLTDSDSVSSVILPGRA